MLAQTRSSVPSTPSAIGRKPDLAILLACVLAAIPILYLAPRQFVEYDGYWHVFIAQQDKWQNFWWDYMHNDHPLLFYLLLKLVVHVGRSPFLYRLISMASGLASVYMVGRIAGKLSASKVIPFLTALAFGLAMPTVEIAISVRSYMLSIFFVLLSFYFFLDLIEPAAASVRKSRVLFVLSSILAISSHYFAFFYIGGCVAVLVAWGIFRRDVPRKTWLAHALTFLPVFAVMACFYVFHIRHVTGSLDYLSDYLWSRPEPKIKFLLRGLHSLFNFLAPWTIADRRNFEKVAVVLMVGVLALTPFRKSRGAAPLLMLSVLVSELAFTGLRGRYPFGGLMRQQFIVFPFVILSAAVCLDRILAALPRGRARWAGTAAVCAGILAISAVRFDAYPKDYEELFTTDMNRFNAAIPNAQAVFLDQFNLIAYFTHHHQWQWKYSRRLLMLEPVDEYTMSLGEHQTIVLRDRDRWNFDFADPGFFHDVAEAIRSAKLTSLSVFCIHQIRGVMTPDQQDKFEQKAFALAEAQHLQIRKFIPDGLNVYAEFAPAAPSR